MSDKYTAVLFLLFISPFVAKAQYNYSTPFDGHVIIHLSDYTVYADVLPDKKDGKANPEKTYYWNISDTIQATRGGYSGKLLDGSYKEVFPDKNLKASGQFKMGLKTGKWYHWYPGGKLRKISTWRSGNETGPFRLYDRDGDLMQSGKYKKGLLNGIIRTYSVGDTLSSSDTVMVAKYRGGVKAEGWKGSVFSRTWRHILDFIKGDE